MHDLRTMQMHYKRGCAMNVIKQESFLTEINEGSGYVLNVKLSEDELNRIREMIHSHAVSLVSKFYPDLKEKCEQTPMDEFHTLSELIDHKKVWTKINRIFPQEFIAEIKKMPFVDQLNTMFGEVKAANEEDLYEEEIYWRFVRPGQKNDIGPLHADKWFWDLGHGEMPQDCFRLKIWIPIWCEKAGNGLRVVPHSQKDNYKCDKEERDGCLKPVFNENDYQLDVLPLSNKSGESVIFHDELLHGGCFNSMDKSRVSIEFTMLVKKENV